MGIKGVLREGDAALDVFSRVSRRSCRYLADDFDALDLELRVDLIDENIAGLAGS